MSIVSQALQNKKQSAIWSIRPQATVFEALALLADKNVGVLIVIDENEVVGIFSERDYARKVTLHGRSSKTTPVHKVMSSPVISVKANENVRKCMEVMMDNHIRHLLVVDNDNNAVGVISIGDILKAVVVEQRKIIKHLEGLN